ncbi:EGF family domain-containing protein [Besnoitia besnoiti]|uniref:EGF family domain-containing protein n=1 Tax=Besnoitia besnoiti TaxID=94643 RepID=A0A2A9M671_BESBE|nr:EGF family domain-containing protein [Besnoitia besnoiti]PFH33465.1 EGF family domain-containing protein [Besnoitia besnoiti]
MRVRHWGCRLGQLLVAGGFLVLWAGQGGSAVRWKGYQPRLQAAVPPQGVRGEIDSRRISTEQRERGSTDFGQESALDDEAPLSALEAQIIYTGTGSCSSSPCGQDAYCKDYASGFGCTCHLGFFWDGKTCISIRQHHLCAPGHPQDYVVQNVYSCVCPSGYSTGTATLSNGATVETCMRAAACEPGYYFDGTTCKLATDQLCAPGKLGAQTESGGFTCVCPEGYETQTDTISRNVSVQRCVEDPCTNKCKPGTCRRDTDSELGYACQCLDGYTLKTTAEGQSCEQDPCSKHPCGADSQHHKCTNKGGEVYSCVCAPGYTFNGTTCTIAAADLCDPGTVQPAGDTGGYTCSCPAGYQAQDVVGSDSEGVPRQRCAEDVCYRKCDNGTCVPKSPSTLAGAKYTCSCNKGFTLVEGDKDSRCERDPCAGNPCGPAEDQHVCRRTEDDVGYACKCAPGYTFNGTTCTIAAADLCDPGTVQPAGDTGGYTCSCPAGYQAQDVVGSDSEGVPRQRCAEDVCYRKCDNGTCVPKSPSTLAGAKYTCSCNKGFTLVEGDKDSRCERDPCAGNPCGPAEDQHVCRRTEDDVGYACKCASGFFFNETTCTRATNELCSPGELGEQGKVNEYTCACPPEWVAESFTAAGNVTLQRCSRDVCVGKCSPGDCVAASDNASYTCECPKAHRVAVGADGGEVCRVSACAADPCGAAEAGHECTDTEESGYTCRCALGFFFDGQTCLEASDAQCRPGVLGVQQKPNVYSCVCPQRYRAQSYESGGVILQRCTEDPCFAKCLPGTCTPSEGPEAGFACSCPVGYTAAVGEQGQYCKADPCAKHPCGDKADGHKCSSTADGLSYSCVCAPGFYLNGSSCEAATDALCSPGTIGPQTTTNEYTCVCPPQAEVESFPAPGNVTLQRCVVGSCAGKCGPGTCSRSLASPYGYACDCPDGYSVAVGEAGEECRKNPCLANPCGAPYVGHTCRSLGDSSYSCRCANGYFFNGNACEAATDEMCSPGRLGDETKLNSYVCSCPGGYRREEFEGNGGVTLERCVKDICFGKCEPGDCTRLEGSPPSYTCECPEKYSVLQAPAGESCQADPCSVSPCGPEGQGHVCTNKEGMEYSCVCKSKYYYNGKTCLPFSSTLCSPGSLGTQKRPNEYTCKCPSGYAAEDVPVAEDVTQQKCIKAVCLNKCANGTCVSAFFSRWGYSCHCDDGYDVATGPEGEYCKKDVCAEHPCGDAAEGHTCRGADSDPGYVCTCEMGFYFDGTSCKRVEDAVCQPGTVAALTPNAYTCSCPDKYVEEDFTVAGNVTLQRCVKSICDGKCANGVCSRDSSRTHGFACQCDPGFSVSDGEEGEFCKKDPCTLKPCGEGPPHQCITESETEYSCVCASRYYYDGTKCLLATDDLCDPGELAVVQNPQPNTYACTCPNGFLVEEFPSPKGSLMFQRCKKDACFEKCQHGSCSADDSAPGGYKCSCSPGYSVRSTEDGEHCVADPCSSNPCGSTAAGHQCANQGGMNYACTCAAGHFFNGTTCKVPTNELCEPGELAGDAVNNAYACTCPEEYIMETFTGAGNVTLQRCVKDPCLGKCAPGECTRDRTADFGYVCECTGMYSVAETESGPICRDDPCKVHPCGPSEELHECRNTGGKNYECECAWGYYFNGASCQILSESVCDPGDAVQQVVNEYTCSCPKGHTRDTFESPEGAVLENCVTDTCYQQCQHGTCVRDKSAAFGYQCQCSEGYLVRGGAPSGGGPQCVVDPCAGDACGEPEAVHSCVVTDDLSASCMCNEGFAYNKFIKKCTDQSPCDYGACGPSEGVARCTSSSAGSWSCECRQGFQVAVTSENKQYCVRWSFCDGDPCGPPADGNVCVSALTGYTCRCGSGYTLVREAQPRCERVTAGSPVPEAGGITQGSGEATPGAGGEAPGEDDGTAPGENEEVNQGETG